MFIRNYSCLLVALLLSLTACSRWDSATSNSQTNASSSNTTTNANNDPSSKAVFSREIAPLMVTNCTNCHRSQGGIAPFPLETYNDFVSHLKGIRKALVDRTMPPPGVDNSGSCQNFSDARWLSETDLNTLVGWIDNGAPQGDPNFKPQIPVASPGLSEPKIALKIPTPYTPQPEAGKLDDYRCFVVDPQVTSDTKITGVEVLPEQPKIVHHVIVFKPTSDEAQAQAIQKDGADGRPGYSCFGAAGVSTSIVGLWAPGGTTGEMKNPDTGTLLGLRLEAGRKLIMQIHYNTANGTMKDQTAIVLKTNSQASAVKWMVFANTSLDLPPGQSNVTSTVTQTNKGVQTVDHFFTVAAGQGFSWSSLFSTSTFNVPPARDMKIYALGPHMHTLGRSMKLEMIDSSNRNTCMAKIPLFDFNWQGGSFFQKPLNFASTSSLKITCGFNTIGRTEAVHFGEGTNEEMCLAFLLVSE